MQYLHGLSSLCEAIGREELMPVYRGGYGRYYHGASVRRTPSGSSVASGSSSSGIRRFFSSTSVSSGDGEETLSMPQEDPVDRKRALWLRDRVGNGKRNKSHGRRSSGGDGASGGQMGLMRYFGAPVPQPVVEKELGRRRVPDFSGIRALVEV